MVLGENADVVSMKIAESGIVIYQGKAAAPLRIGEPVDLRPMKRFDDDFWPLRGALPWLPRGGIQARARHGLMGAL